MSDLSLIPLQDGFETQLSQDWDGATGTVYVLATPSYTPTTTNTCIVVNPGKTNMQIAEITDYDSTAKTLTVSSISFEKGLGISSTAQSHSTGSKVIISDNYQFWEDIQTAVNSKLDDTGGTMTGLLQFTGTTHAGIKLLSLTTVQRDALSASNGMIIYNSTTGELNQYIGGAWSAVAAGSTQPTASTTVLGKIKTDVTPSGDPVALITDNPKYDALAGTAGTPSASNKYVTNDDTTGTGDVVRESVTDEFVIGNKYFGDGSDGAATFDGAATILGMIPAANVYTMTRDIYLTNCTVNSGVFINTAGYRIFGTGTLTNNGTIRNNGGNGGNATNSSAGASGTVGAAGATAVAGVTVFSSGGAGTAGALGKNTNGAGINSTNPTSVTNAVASAGGTGGAGGQGGGNAGGTAGTSTATTAGTNGLRDLVLAQVMYTTAGVIKAGTAGGGGGGGGVQEVGSVGTGFSGAGGGGGGAGGVVYVAFRLIAGSGSITATGGTGGNGGNAFLGSATNTGFGGGGAGGGGAGGVVIVITKTSTNPLTISAAGGTGGTGGTLAQVGSVTTSTNGANGSNGATGVTCYFVI